MYNVYFDSGTSNTRAYLLYAAEYKQAGSAFLQSMRVPFCEASWCFVVLKLIEAFKLGIVHSHLVCSF
ncbi:MAG: hypothetical protein JG777_1893 [Clostridia bacterium]|jgi:hypothetical protein|nr:hypothetical protein [Clostridia bacterium]